MNKTTMFVLLLLLLLQVSPVTWASQPMSLTLGEALIEPSPMAINGMNYGNWMILHDLAAEYHELNIPLLRFPAGNYGDENLLTHRALERFVRAAEFLGAEPMVQHNILQGTPEEAAHWVQVSLDEGWGIRYWFIGNEPDLFATNRAQPHWTPEFYAQTFRDYAQAIKAVDPQAQVIGPVVTGTPNERWIKTFLNTAGDVVDILAWQWYPSDGSMDREEALATAVQVRDHMRMFRQWMADPAINPRGYQREIPLFLSEFGLSWRTNHARLLTDMTAALWLAEAWSEMLLEGMDYAAYFALQGTGGHGLFDVAWFPRPTYFVTWMLARMGPVWHEVDGIGPRETMVAYASRADEQWSVLLINKSQESIPVKLPAAEGVVHYWVDHQEQEEIWFRRAGSVVDIPAYTVNLVTFPVQ